MQFYLCDVADRAAPPVGDSVKISLTLPPEFLALCKRDKVDPERVLRGFIADVAGIQNWVYPNPDEGRFPREKDGYQSNGSDERRLAYEYYERVGYWSRFK